VAKCSKRVEPGDAAMSDLRAMRDLPMAHPTRAPHHLDAFALPSRVGQGERQYLSGERPFDRAD